MSLKNYIGIEPQLETKSLVLRSLCADDVPALKEWMADKSVYKFWGMNPGKNDKNPELLFAKAKAPVKSFHWGIISKENGKAIGEFWVYLIENDRMAKVAARLSPAEWGKGYAFEALARVVEFCFTETELKRLWTDVHVDNHASYKTLEKAGFIREGMVRQGKMGNMFCDYYLYGLLREDFECKGL